MMRAKDKVNLQMKYVCNIDILFIYFLIKINYTSELQSFN